MLIRPRDYQITAHEALGQYLATSTGNPVVAMPTGTGKSVNIAMVCYEVLMRRPASRILGLTHVKELIRQNAGRLLDAWPEAPLGIYSAGLNRKEIDQAITFGGIASVKNVVDQLSRVDYLIIDECHLLNSGGDTMYKTLIETLRKRNPYMRVIGFTATPYRMGQGLITVAPNGGDRIFTDFAVDMTGMAWFNWFINEGYLSKLVTMSTGAYLDVSGVGMANGDYKLTELQEALDGLDDEHEKALKEAIERGQGRSKWLAFTAGIERAEWVSDRLNGWGIKSTFVHNMIERGERDERIADYRAGRYQCMVGNNIFTTGFDDPSIDFILMLRPTKSTPLWVQMLGRGTRPLYVPGYDMMTAQGRHWSMMAGGKHDCLVLDFARNTENLGPVNDPLIPRKKGEGGGDIPTKICPVCGAYNHLSARLCDNCGAEFPPGMKLTRTAFSGEIIRTEAAILEWFDVQTVMYRVHQKGAGRPSVCVTYGCGFRSFTEFVFIEHDGIMSKWARDWWRTRCNDPRAYEEGPPATAVELVEKKYLLKWPKKIQVHSNHKPYPEVLHYEYE